MCRVRVWDFQLRYITLLIPTKSQWRCFGLSCCLPIQNPPPPFPPAPPPPLQQRSSASEVEVFWRLWGATLFSLAPPLQLKPTVRTIPETTQKVVQVLGWDLKLNFHNCTSYSKLPQATTSYYKQQKATCFEVIASSSCFGRNQRCDSFNHQVLNY